MGIYDNFQELQAELERCSKCGNCQAVCPIYGDNLKESDVARGKIALIEAFMDGRLEMSQKLYDTIVHCLVCGSCKVKCSSGVNIDKIMLSARAEFIRRKGLHPLKKIIFSVLKQPGILGLGIKTGAAVQDVMFKRHPIIQRYYPRIPMGIDMKKIIPNLHLNSFRDRMPEVVQVENPIKRVAFFTGCSTNYMYPEIGEATINVLKENKVEVVIPKKQYCCGLAVFASGDVETARKLAKENVDIFSKLDVDAIISTCGSCGGTMKHEWWELLKDDTVYSEKLKKLKPKMYDISEFLVDVIKYRKPKGKLKMDVTYHDSCHLKKSQGISAQPRQILNNIEGVNFKEMKSPDACCGCGGSFSLIFYDTSLGIVKKKIEDANGTGANYIATGCPGCTMHIEDGVNRFGREQEVIHTVQILNKAYGVEK